MAAIKKILFVCFFGKQRSPTAQDVFNSYFKLEGIEDFYHAGFASLRQIKKNKGLVEKAFKIVALEPLARGYLFRNFPELKTSNRFYYLPLPRLKRRNSRSLIEKISKYYFSEKWY